MSNVKSQRHYYFFIWTFAPQGNHAPSHTQTNSATEIRVCTRLHARVEEGPERWADRGGKRGEMGRGREGWGERGGRPLRRGEEGGVGRPLRGGGREGWGGLCEGQASREEQREDATFA